MILIKLSRSNWDYADQLAEEVMANNPVSTSGLEYTHERLFNGYSAELGLAEWFDDESIEHTHLIDTSKKVAFDFLVHEGGDWTLDVKNAGQPHHQMLMYPADQDAKWDIVFGTKITRFPREVELHGWLGSSEKDKLKEVERNIPSFEYPLAKLRDPEALLVYFRRLRERHGDNPHNRAVEE